MDLTIEWWGTAAFRIRYGNWTGLLDPFVTRNPFSQPKLDISLEEAAKEADYAFLSHGHFDHVMDVPALIRMNPKLKVFGGHTAVRTVRRDMGYDTASFDQIQEVMDGPIQLASGSPVTVEVQNSKHVRFDRYLIIKTLARAAFSKSRSFLRPELLTQYPCGETLSYRFNFGGIRMLFLGSAGPTRQMLDSWAQEPLDCLLVPIQGSSWICEIAANIVLKLRPRVVIPQHHDNFYPPISQFIDISDFRNRVKSALPSTRILELQIGQIYKWKAGHYIDPAKSKKHGILNEHGNLNKKFLEQQMGLNMNPEEWQKMRQEKSSFEINEHRQKEPEQNPDIS